MAKKTNMLLTLVITNNAALSKTGLVIEPKSIAIEGENISQAVGKALKAANEVLAPGQYDQPEVKLILLSGEELVMTQKHVKMVAKPFWDFRLQFPIIRESLLADFASKHIDEAASRLAYVKATDNTGYYKNTKAVTVEQAAAQMKERVRVVREVTKWAIEDARASVVTPEIEARRLADKEKAKARRLAAAEEKKQLTGASK